MMIEEEDDDSFDSSFVSSFICSMLRIMETSTGFDEEFVVTVTLQHSLHHETYLE
jgi:hypothetical protein